MKPQHQKVYDDRKGDCFRACVASLFEFPIEAMPNFWEKTRDPDEFFCFVNDWLCERFGYACILLEGRNDIESILRGLFCVAIGRPSGIHKDDVEHAVVWKDGQIIHDPNPYGGGLKGKPIAYAVFVPVHPVVERKEKQFNETFVL